MMSLHGHDDVSRLGTGGALLALPPAPAPRRDPAILIRKDDFARYWMLNLRFVECRKAFRALRKVDGQNTSNGPPIKHGDRQRIANTDQVCQVYQRIDLRQVAFFREAAQ